MPLTTPPAIVVVPARWGTWSVKDVFVVTPPWLLPPRRARP